MAKYGLFGGYQRSINANLNWYGMVKVFRLDSSKLGLDANGIQLGAGLKHDFTDQFYLKGGLSVNKAHHIVGSYPTIELEAVYKFNKKYRFKFKLEDNDGELGGQLGLGYSF